MAILILNLMAIGHALPMDKERNFSRKVDRLALHEVDVCLVICAECLWDDLNKRNDKGNNIREYNYFVFYFVNL